MINAYGRFRENRMGVTAPSTAAVSVPDSVPEEMGRTAGDNVGAATGNTSPKGLPSAPAQHGGQRLMDGAWHLRDSR
jgi:hypothetical protein